MTVTLDKTKLLFFLNNAITVRIKNIDIMTIPIKKEITP